MSISARGSSWRKRESMNGTRRTTLLSCVRGAWRFRCSVGQVNDSRTFRWRSAPECIRVNDIRLLLVQHRSGCLWWEGLQLRVFATIFPISSSFRAARVQILILPREHCLAILEVAILSSHSFTKLLQPLGLDVESFGEVDLFRIVAEKYERFKGGDRIRLLVNAPQDVVEKRLQRFGDAGAG